MSGFTRAVKSTAKARIGLYGVSGSGKTMHALGIARVLAGPQGKIALLDTEGGSASKYADLFEFDTNEMRKPFHPERFGKALDAAVAAGYDVFVADGISPFWSGPGGTLGIVDDAKKRGGGWADGSKENDKLISAILHSPIHLVVTVRAKADVAVETVNGKVTYRKVGIKMIQRDELDYEVDVLLYLDLDNSATVEKSRKPDELGQRIDRDDVREWAVGFKGWLDTGSNGAVVVPYVAPDDPLDDVPFSEDAAPAVSCPAESPTPGPVAADEPAAILPGAGGGLIDTINDAQRLVNALTNGEQLATMKRMLGMDGKTTRRLMADELFDQFAGWDQQDILAQMAGWSS